MTDTANLPTEAHEDESLSAAANLNAQTAASMDGDAADTGDGSRYEPEPDDSEE